MHLPKFILSLWLATLSLVVYAQQAYQVQDYQVRFFIKNAGITVEGSLEGLEAEVLFHPRKPSKSRIAASIDPSTIQTGIKIRDKHLKRSDYFDVEEYPSISLRSLGFSRSEPGEVIGTFELAIKDVQQEIAIPISYQNSGDTLRLEGSFTINRQDFGLGDSSIILADEVEVKLMASLERLEM